MANSKDVDDFYAADLGASVEVDASTTSARSTQLGQYRWLAQVYDVASATQVWIRLGGSSVEAAAEAPSTLIYGGGVSAIEFIARPGRDHVAVITNAGTAKVLLSPVSAHE